MNVPFVDLKTQYANLRDDMMPAIDSVCAGSRFILGDDVKQFEHDFAAYLGVKHAIGVASGTDALHLALRALDIGEGAEVITAANTFIATAGAIWQAGARPVFVDCEPESYNMDPAALKKAITGKTRAVIPVHLYGQTANMTAILAIAREAGIRVIEDACQAHGAYHGNARAGSMGDIGCFSFYPGKNLGAYGDGGAVVANDPELAAKIRVLRDHGQTEKYRHMVKGFNSRLDGIQAAVLGVKLPHLDIWNAKRAEHAAAYSEALAKIGGIVVPKVVDYGVNVRGKLSHVFHLYVVRVPKRDRVKEALAAAGVQTGIHYPIPIHLQSSFAELGYGKGGFPLTEKYADEALSLPMFPELSREQVAHVCRSLAGAMKA